MKGCQMDPQRCGWGLLGGRGGEQRWSKEIYSVLNQFVAVFGSGAIHSHLCLV